MFTALIFPSHHLFLLHEGLWGGIMKVCDAIMKGTIDCILTRRWGTTLTNLLTMCTADSTDYSSIYKSQHLVYWHSTALKGLSLSLSRWTKLKYLNNHYISYWCSMHLSNTAVTASLMDVQCYLESVGSLTWHNLHMASLNPTRNMYIPTCQKYEFSIPSWLVNPMTLIKPEEYSVNRCLHLLNAFGMRTDL